MQHNVSRRLPKYFLLVGLFILFLCTVALGLLWGFHVLAAGTVVSFLPILLCAMGGLFFVSPLLPYALYSIPRRYLFLLSTVATTTAAALLLRGTLTLPVAYFPYVLCVVMSLLVLHMLYAALSYNSNREVDWYGHFSRKWYSASNIAYLFEGFDNGDMRMVDRLADFSVLSDERYRINFWKTCIEVGYFLAGDHYDFGENGYGKKGLLDILLFPLFARQLASIMYETKQLFRGDLGVFGHFVVLPLFVCVYLIIFSLEVLRAVTSLALTAALSPFIWVAYFFMKLYARRTRASRVAEVDTLRCHVVSGSKACLRKVVDAYIMDAKMRFIQNITPEVKSSSSFEEEIKEEIKEKINVLVSPTIDTFFANGVPNRNTFISANTVNGGYNPEVLFNAFNALNVSNSELNEYRKTFRKNIFKAIYPNVDDVKEKELYERYKNEMSDEREDDGFLTTQLERKQMRIYKEVDVFLDSLTNALRQYSFLYTCFLDHKNTYEISKPKPVPSEPSPEPSPEPPKGVEWVFDMMPLEKASVLQTMVENGSFSIRQMVVLSFRKSLVNEDATSVNEDPTSVNEHYICIDYSGDVGNGYDCDGDKVFIPLTPENLVGIRSLMMLALSSWWEKPVRHVVFDTSFEGQVVKVTLPPLKIQLSRLIDRGFDCVFHTNRVRQVAVNAVFQEVGLPAEIAQRVTDFLPEDHFPLAYRYEPAPLKSGSRL